MGECLLKMVWNKGSIAKVQVLPTLGKAVAIGVRISESRHCRAEGEKGQAIATSPSNYVRPGRSRVYGLSHDGKASRVI